MVAGAPPSFNKQEFRLAVEQSYGVLPASPNWRAVKSAMASPEPTFETDPFIASGDSLPTVMSLDDDYTQGDIEGKGCYNTLAYYLSSMFGPATVVANGPSAFDWTWTWDGRRTIIPVSFGMDFGVPDAADRVLGTVFNGLGMSGGRDGGFDFSSAILGKAMAVGLQAGGTTNEVQTLTITGSPTGGTFTLSYGGFTTTPIDFDVTADDVEAALEALLPIGIGGVQVAGTAMPGGSQTITFHGHLAGLNVATITQSSAGLTGGTTPAVVITATTPGGDTATEIVPKPIFATQGAIFMDNSAGAWGTTRLLNVYEMDMAWGERYDRARPINDLFTSDHMVEVADQEHTVALSFGVNAIERANFDAVRAGTLKFPRVRWQGPEISSGVNYLAQFDMAILYESSAAISDTQNVAVREWTGRLARNVGGNCVVIKLTNTLASL